MHALIPHKDTVNILCMATRKILLAYNSRQSLSALPVFPLWAFLQKPLESPSLMTVFDYAVKDGKLVFPVEVSDAGETVRTEIVFGRLNNPESNEKMTVSEIQEQFPVFLRVFKTGNAVFQDNSWKLFDEKWFKCKN